MEVKWFVLLTVAGLAISFVAGNRCDTENVSACYTKLVHYEGLGFPLYGEDEQALDETCNSINESFDCLDDYLRACNKNEDCDEKCEEIIKDIGMFILNTGLRNLQSELCDPLSPMRLTYLDNYVCLEDNADHYAKCHNDSQISQEYMSTITERAEALYARCCFFNWYEGCFTNITRDTCNDNATFFVNMSLHKLMGHIVKHLCEDSDVMCSRPPLPDDGKPILTNNDIDDCSDGNCKTDQTNIDVDNCVDENCHSSSCFLMFSASNLFISLCSVVLIKYLISIK
ncbi:uncharacterized protein LOC129961886 [Argiope bruennichi]|uniref:uncharacterized protein LOC129961886 n=1 Tax=Argiope bruennichi TaxID=94029 RepID=UPI0024950462|nr:uncharacterized protein LOC129961886 [Argiope bruennichi]